MFHFDDYIVIVEDSSGMREMVKQFLFDEGYKNVMNAEDGQAALDLLGDLYNKGSEVSLIVCDLNMPRLSGADLLKKIRNHPKYNGIPFVVITSQSDAESVIQILDLGATDYIVKPFDRKQFMDKLNAVSKRVSS